LADTGKNLQTCKNIDEEKNALQHAFTKLMTTDENVIAKLLTQLLQRISKMGKFSFECTHKL